MTQPKYPVGTLLRHRASGEKALVTWAIVREPKGAPPYMVYGLELAPDSEFEIEVEIDGVDEIGLRYERVEAYIEKQQSDQPAYFIPPAWHAPGFRTDAPVKIDPKSPVVEITCRTCKQTYEWIPGEGDPFCPRCEPDYPLTATPRDA